MEYFNIQVASTWHIPGQYVSICGNTMRDCTIQLCLVKTSRVRHIIIQQMHEYHSQAGAFHLVLQALGRRFVNLREMGQSKSCLICPIICCVHAVIIECTVAAPVHVHSSFHSYLYKWWGRGVNTLSSENLPLGGRTKAALTYIISMLFLCTLPELSITLNCSCFSDSFINSNTRTTHSKPIKKITHSECLCTQMHLNVKSKNC